MTALIRVWRGARRGVAERWPWLAVAVVGWSLGQPGIWGAGVGRGDMAPLAMASMLGVALVTVIARELDAARARDASTELESAAVMVTGVYTLIAATGGLHSIFEPLAFAVVSFLVVVARRFSAVVGLLAIATTLAWVIAGGWTPRTSADLGTHLTFLGFFALGHRVVLAGVVRRLRRRHADSIEQELQRIRQEARDFRLISSSLPPQSRARSRGEEELRMAQAAVESIHEGLFHTLELLRSSMNLHTCALVWCEADGAGKKARVQLKVKEVSSASESLLDRPVLGNPGVLTSVLAEPKTLRLKALGGRRSPPYYATPDGVTDLCAVPLLEQGVLRGILCADRTGDRAFTDGESEVLERACAQVLRVVTQERSFLAVERGKYEQEQFYRASEMLGEAVTLEQVYQRTFAAMRTIVQFDLAAIVAPVDDQLRVAAIEAGPAEPWAGLTERLRGHPIDARSSLVAIALKNRQCVPAGGVYSDDQAIVFDRETKLRGARSLLVLPLQHGDQSLGAIVLAAARENLFPRQIREMLGVIVRQVSVSLQNARMYDAMERQATTDGLTGLTNHRAFQERLGQLHDLSERSGQSYSLVLTDIDHFKSINDTYGHPVGDAVLKRVASVLVGRARKADVVARYGGEEFVLVLPDTSGEAAEHVANQLREEIGALVMSCEHGTFKLTMSMGVAEFPSDDRDRHTLIEKADQALYFCKENGRNRVRRWKRTRA